MSLSPDAGNDIVITFTPPKPGVPAQWDAQPEVFEVDPGTSLIRVTLVTDDGTPAVFAPNATTWLAPGTTMVIPIPADFGVRATGDKLEILDVNTDTTTTEYSFVVNVVWDGFAFSSPDPTIINRQPGLALSLSFFNTRAEARKISPRRIA